MAETETNEEVVEPKRGFMKTLLVTAVVGVVSAAIGFSIPMLFPALLGNETAASEPTEPQLKFIPFGEVIVNLDEGRMNRYLGITLLLAAAILRQL